MTTKRKIMDSESTEYTDADFLDPLGSIIDETEHSPKKLRSNASNEASNQSNNFTDEEKELIFGKFVQLDPNSFIYPLPDYLIWIKIKLIC